MEKNCRAISRIGGKTLPKKQTFFLYITWRHIIIKINNGSFNNIPPERTVNHMQKIGIIVILLFNHINYFFTNASGLANFCTIILFVLFVIGKIWILKRNMPLYNENFEYILVDKDEEFNRQFLLGEKETIKLSSPDGIYDIIVYVLNRTEKGKPKRTRISSALEDGIQHPLKLNKNEPVYLRMDLPCGMPDYQLEIIKYDYVKLIVELGANGKVGGIWVNVKVRCGVRSLLYYLCQ
ncbi:hypothetical protein [Clostridium sp. AF21-20LB]|jgi:hypothetical protein|uniref:hypothetical protein n=1 Tax=Clostridium sp. AF21-20LB TaxID=2293003 RepID=UPI000E53CD3D|nr:hypothetical protein DWX76_13160 [Clostridium sp. AF21-20LB]